MELIDKSALVSEIERRIKSTNNDVKIGAIESLTVSKTLNSLISFINTLEVKEVDLEKVIEQTYHDRSVTDTVDMDHITYENIAKYFFELGLKHKKRE